MISLVVSSFVNKLSTMASMSDKRRWCFLTSCGSNVPLRSLGTSIWMASTLSVTTVFDRVPLWELLVPRPTGVVLVIA